MSILERLEPLERRLVAAGFPTMSEWWRATVARFYESGHRQLVLRVGRRGGKSSTLCRIAVLEALYGGHVVPPGDIGVVAIVSVSRDEASQRLRTVKAVLDALGIAYRPIDGGIELEGRPVAFKVYTASISGVSGFTAIAIICDEVAKWRDSDTGSNPAKEVLASIRPTIAGQPNAKIFLSSSPMGTEDAHATAFDAGETDFQSVAFAETWTARPALTEAETRGLETDERVWKREYAAIPQAGAIGAFDPDDVAALARDVHPESYGLSVGAIFTDSSSGRGDGWSWCIGQYICEPSGSSIYLEREVFDERTGKLTMRIPIYDGDGAPIPNPHYGEPSRRLYVSDIGCLEGHFAKTTPMDAIVDHIAQLARSYGITRAYGDQYLQYALVGAFAARGIQYIDRAWTSPSKIEATSTLRRMMRERTIVVQPGDEAAAMQRELLTVEERISLSSGALTIQARRSGGHADRASLLLLMARCESEGEIAGSPISQGPGVTSYDPYTNSFGS